MSESAFFNRSRKRPLHAIKKETGHIGPSSWPGFTMVKIYIKTQTEHFAAADGWTEEHVLFSRTG